MKSKIDEIESIKRLALTHDKLGNDAAVWDLLDRLHNLLDEPDIQEFYAVLCRHTS